MKRNGPERWCCLPIGRWAFWRPGRARYNYLGWMARVRMSRGDIPPAQSVAQLVAQPIFRALPRIGPVASLEVCWFRQLGERRFMAFRRDPSSDLPIRVELVARVREEIRLGIYETPEKLQLALERLLQALGKAESEE